MPDLPKAGASASNHRLPPSVPKDTIPVVKTPRRQRSSRFIAQQDHVELEPTPRFNGKCIYVCVHIP